MGSEHFGASWVQEHFVSPFYLPLWGLAENLNVSFKYFLSFSLHLASTLINCSLIHPADVALTSLALCPFSTPPYALYLLITVNDGVLLCSLPSDKVVNTIGVTGKTPFDPDPSCFAKRAAFPALVAQPGATPCPRAECTVQWHGRQLPSRKANILLLAMELWGVVRETALARCNHRAAHGKICVCLLPGSGCVCLGCGRCVVCPCEVLSWSCKRVMSLRKIIWVWFVKKIKLPKIVLPSGCGGIFK